MSFPLAFFGMPGHFELLIIAGVVLLLFGNRLPGAMRSPRETGCPFATGSSWSLPETSNATSTAPWNRREITASLVNACNVRIAPRFSAASAAASARLSCDPWPM